MTATYTDLIEQLLAEGDAKRMTRRRGAWNGESAAVAAVAAKAIEALQADNDRLQAEVTRLLTAFDGLDLDDKPPQWRVENGEIVPTPENVAALATKGEADD